jgi:Flp pilus assembly protein TadB
MKFPQLFTKIPKHKRFDYIPRHYDPQEEERKEREHRIRTELEREGAIEKKGNLSGDDTDITGYRERITGSFRVARRAGLKQSDPSASLIRLAITLILTLGLLAYLQFGINALYGVAAVFIPFYLYLKFRSAKR